MLSVRGLVVEFPGVHSPVTAVRGVDFDLAPHEVLCIVGESGSGKSLTALALCGLLPPAASMRGEIRLGEVDIGTAPPASLRKLRGQDIGFIFQDPTTTLNPVLPIGRQITEAPRVHGSLSARDAPARAVALLREVDIPDPEGRVAQFPHQFSGGMRQRAVIAMAMAGRPRLIVADEPTTALDVTVQAQVLAMLARRRAASGAAMILITHDLGVVAEVADRVLVMYAGRIVESGPVDAIFQQPRHPYTRALLRSMPRLDATGDRLDPIAGQPPLPASMPAGCAFHPRCRFATERCRQDDPMLRPLGNNQAAACHFAETLVEPAPIPELQAAPRATADTPLLQVDNLQVHFPMRSKILRRRTGVVRAVDGVSFSLAPGETLGLVGESGCGKTTTGRAIMGLIHTTGGQASIAGKKITGLSRTALRPIRRHMQYIFQDPYASLNPVLTVAEIIAEPMRIHGLYNQLGGARRIAELLDIVGLSQSFAGRRPAEFSGGQKQRIGIARALALQPRLLILDEPVAALDVSIQAQIVNLLQDLQRDLGLAYLFIAHDLAVVRHISDRVAVMYLGRIVELADKATLYARPLHPYTQSLLSAAPIPDPARRHDGRRIVLTGEIPNPARPPSGCRFHPRCFRATDICASEIPEFRRYPGQATEVACHHPGPPG